jgi:hypothetical protein
MEPFNTNYICYIAKSNILTIRPLFCGFVKKLHTTHFSNLNLEVILHNFNKAYDMLFGLEGLHVPLNFESLDDLFTGFMETLSKGVNEDSNPTINYLCMIYYVTMVSSEIKDTTLVITGS